MVNDLTPTIDSSIRSVDSSNDLLKEAFCLAARTRCPRRFRFHFAREHPQDAQRLQRNAFSESYRALALTQAAVDINLASAQIAGDIQTAKANVDTALPKRTSLSATTTNCSYRCATPVASTDQVQKAISDIEAQNASLSSTITLLGAARKPARQQCASGQECHGYRGQRSKNKCG